MSGNDPELMPCPFCGSEKIRVLDEGSFAWLFCTECEADGPVRKSQHLAIAASNMRLGRDLSFAKRISDELTQMRNRFGGKSLARIHANCDSQAKGDHAIECSLELLTTIEHLIEEELGVGHEAD